MYRSGLLHDARVRGRVWGSSFGRMLGQGVLAVSDGPRVRDATMTMAIGGVFRCQHLRDGEVIDEWEKHNLIVNQGLDHILGVEFCGVPQITNWYLAPFSNNYTPVATDTAASISSNSGELSNYTGGQRLAYTGTEAQQQVGNSAAPAIFTITGQRTSIFGAFLISSSGIGSTAGTLFAASAFGNAKTLDVGDQLSMTYAIGAQSA